jgi:hypothetical protein
MLQAKKKRKAQAKASSSSHSSSSRSGSSGSGGAGGSSCTTFCWILFVLFVVMSGSLYYLNYSNIKGVGNTGRLGLLASAKEGLKDQENLQALLHKAQALALHYKNLTGSLPVDHHQVLQNMQQGISHLRRSDALPVAASQPVTTTIRQGVSPVPAHGVQSSSSTGRNGEPKRDVVIGIAHDMDPKNFVVFCASLREVNRKAELIIFSNAPTSAQNVKIAGDFDVTLLEYDMRNLEQFGGSSHMSKFHPSTLRWPFIAKYFDEQSTRDQYSRVWMADVRDTYFQSDPFEMLPEYEKGFFTFGGVDITIKDCGWNGNWVKDCFGDQMLDKIGRNKVICSGVSMGDMESAYSYLKLMDDVISGKKEHPVSSSSRFPQCERNGVDQVKLLSSSSAQPLIKLCA